MDPKGRIFKSDPKVRIFKPRNSTFLACSFLPSFLTGDSIPYDSGGRPPFSRDTRTRHGEQDTAYCLLPISGSIDSGKKSKPGQLRSLLGIIVGTIAKEARPFHWDPYCEGDRYEMLNGKGVPAQEWSWQSLAEPKGGKSERQQPDEIFGTPGYSYAWSPCQQGHFSHVSQETSLSRISVTCKQNNSHKPVLNKNKAPKEIPIHRQSLWNSRLLSDNDRYWIKLFHPITFL